MFEGVLMKTMEKLPVRNCVLFLGPTDASTWKAAELGGVVGVFVQDQDGNYNVLDVFDTDRLPSYSELVSNARFGIWESLAGGREMLRFDIFPMPYASMERRSEIVALIRRSCGVQPQGVNVNYRKAA